jgi:hypothetical protein
LDQLLHLWRCVEPGHRLGVHRWHTCFTNFESCRNGYMYLMSLDFMTMYTVALRSTSDLSCLQLHSMSDLRWLLAELALGLSNHEVQIRSHARAPPSLMQTTQTYHFASRHKQPAGRLLSIRLSSFMANYATTSTSIIRCANVNRLSLRAIKPNMFFPFAMYWSNHARLSLRLNHASIPSSGQTTLSVSRSNQTSEALAY